MSDVLVKGMKMPKDKPIRIVLNPNGQLFVDHGVHFTEYEAVELPPHGRLIDGDELMKSRVVCDTEEWDDTFRDGCDFALEVVRNAPTIIQAEECE